ncbi:MAG: hypothetical protein HY301_17165 [Verrucomicrobia bacterium]|nr:hypothetical protein [Verrucomicrobiota bacterium]
MKILSPFFALVAFGGSLPAQEAAGFQVSTTATEEVEFGTRLTTTVQLPLVRFDFEPPPGWGLQVEPATSKLVYRAPDNTAAIALTFKRHPPSKPGVETKRDVAEPVPAPVKLSDRVVRQFNNAQLLEEYDCHACAGPQRAAFFSFSNQPGTRTFGRFVTVPFANGELEVMLIANAAEAGRGTFNTLVNSLGSKKLP